MLINGEDSHIIAGPMSSSYVMIVRVTKGEKSVICEIPMNELITWLDGGVKGVVTGVNKIKPENGDDEIELAIGSNIQLPDGEVGVLTEGFQTDVAYTAADLRELNARIYPNGFVSRYYKEKDKFYQINGLKLTIDTASGIIDGLIFTIKRPLTFLFKQGDRYRERIDTLLVCYDKVRNRIEVRMEQGEYPKDKEKPQAYKPQDNSDVCELMICKVSIHANAYKIEQANIDDGRNIIAGYTAADITFSDVGILIEEGKSKNIQNAIEALNTKVEKYNDSEKKERIKDVDDEKLKREAEDESIKNAIESLAADDIKYYDDGVGLFESKISLLEDGDDEQPPLEEEIYYVKDAIAKLNEKIEKVSSDASDVNDNVKEAIDAETKERIKSDSEVTENITTIIDKEREERIAKDTSIEEAIEIERLDKETVKTDLANETNARIEKYNEIIDRLDNLNEVFKAKDVGYNDIYGIIEDGKAKTVENAINVLAKIVLKL